MNRPQDTDSIIKHGNLVIVHNFKLKDKFLGKNFDVLGTSKSEKYAIPPFPITTKNLKRSAETTLPNGLDVLPTKGLDKPFVGKILMD